MTKSLQSRRSTASQLIHAGVATAEIAAITGFSRGYITSIARAMGIRVRSQYHWKEAPRGRPASLAPDARKERIEDMCRLFREGKSMADIGEIYELSRERVRQILKGAGLYKWDGGKTVENNKMRMEKIRAAEASRMAKSGCTVAQYKELLAVGANVKYFGHRQKAKKRGIPFELTAWEWWTIWKNSGKWAQRGSRPDQYVMCRKGDVGPYSVDNVYIATAFENFRDGMKNHRERAKQC